MTVSNGKSAMDILTDFQYACQDLSTTQSHKTELRKQALAALEEVMIQAKPKDWVRSDLIEGYDLGIKLYEQNIRQAFSK